MGDISYWRKSKMGPGRYDDEAIVTDGRPKDIKQVDAENLLKAADDLTNDAYWTSLQATVEALPDGVFKFTCNGTARYYQEMTWVPEWATDVSFIAELSADTGTIAEIAFFINGAYSYISAEVISGPGSISFSGNRAQVQGLVQGQWTKVRLTGDATGFASTTRCYFYNSSAQTGLAYLFRNSQVVLGTTPKPRPAGAGVEDWMMAYRPHNRQTGDGAGRFFVNSSKDNVWLGNELDVITPPVSGSIDRIFVNGGADVLAYGDPGIWLEKYTTGGSFGGRSGFTMFYTVKTLTSGAEQARFGFDNNKAASPSAPYQYLTSNELMVYDSNGFGNTPQPWAVDETLSFFQVYRSDNVGSQFCVHDSGTRWKRYNVNDDALPTTSAFPCICNYNAVMQILDFALLSAIRHEPEWVEVTDAESSPATTTTFSCTIDSSVAWTHTHENTKQVRMFGRFVTPTNYGWMVEAEDDGSLKIFRRASGEGSTSLYEGSAGVLSDGVSYKLEAVVSGSSLSLFLDNALVTTVTLVNDLSQTGGYVTHTLTTNDIELTTHPYPALGGSVGATARIVAPQAGDFCEQESNALLILRNVTMPGTGPADGNTRYINDNNRLLPIIHEDGGLQLGQWNGGSYTNPIPKTAIGQITDGDTKMDEMNGSSYEILVNGKSIIATSGVGHLIGQTVMPISTANGMKADSFESWPLFIEAFDPVTAFAR